MLYFQKLDKILNILVILQKFFELSRINFGTMMQYKELIKCFKQLKNYEYYKKI